MKVMVISDDCSVSDILKNKFTEKNIDIIHYRWFLKAFDNLDEIQPDYIIVNANDYPRHWKVLPAFISVNGYSSKIILYSTTFEITENNRDRTEADFFKIKYFSSCDSIIYEIAGENTDEVVTAPVIENEQIEEHKELKKIEVQDKFDDDFNLFTVSNLLEESFNLTTVDNLLEFLDNDNPEAEKAEVPDVKQDEPEMQAEENEETQDEIIHTEIPEQKIKRKRFELKSPADDVALFAVDTLLDDNETFYEDLDLYSVDSLFPELNEKKLKGSLLRKIIENYERK